MSDREHAQACLREDCRRLGITEIMGISLEAVLERWPIKDLTALRRALPAAPRPIARGES